MGCRMTSCKRKRQSEPLGSNSRPTLHQGKVNSSKRKPETVAFGERLGALQMRTKQLASLKRLSYSNRNSLIRFHSIFAVVKSCARRAKTKENSQNKLQKGLPTFTLSTGTYCNENVIRSCVLRSVERQAVVESNALPILTSHATARCGIECLFRVPAIQRFWFV